MEDFKGKIKDISSAAVGPTLEIVAETFVEGAAGTIIPGVGNMILSYKQNRMEHRVEQTLQKLVERQEELNAAIENLSTEMNEQIRGTYFEMLMDYSINEPQEEKIEYLVNGYINIAKSQYSQEDVVRSFYDTLGQMNMLDVRVFKLYLFASNDNAYSIMEDYHIDASHYRMVQEKLVRLGLIYSKNEEQRDNNVDAIMAYLEDMTKGRNAKLKTKKISRNESYRMTKYGYRFIKFIEAEYGNEEESEIDPEMSQEVRDFLYGN